VGLLKTELRTHAWASALLEEVYAFIQNRKPDVLFQIPQFRFVKAALAEDEKKHHAFLIKEYIDQSIEGPFMKYINNGIAKPLSEATRLSNDHQYRAEFLCFTQHVQYAISGKSAYVSDYQGGLSLLTDPQVMTPRKFGELFGGGNVARFFENFEQQHDCN
ncbi:hypothetical protein F5887DRAFT_841654, partial [Amanita rubescens]